MTQECESCIFYLVKIPLIDFIPNGVYYVRIDKY
jgi:hypothetical protein